MEQSEKALEKLNSAFEEKITIIDGEESSLDQATRNKLKIDLYEQWKDSLIKHTRQCMLVIANSKTVLDTSDCSSDDAAKTPKKSESYLSLDHRNCTTEFAMLKQLVKDMGLRSHEALAELGRLSKIYEKQLHFIKSLSKENSLLKSDVESLRMKSERCERSADKLLISMQEESVNLKRFCTKYEECMQGIDNQSTRMNDEMMQRVKTLENELETKNQQISELTFSLQQQNGKSSARSSSTRISSFYAVPMPAKTNSSSKNYIDFARPESFEINLSDLEASDNIKIRTLEEGASTMAKLLKEKQKMLRHQKEIIKSLQQKLKDFTENEGNLEQLQTKLSVIQFENTKLTKDYDEVLSKSKEYDQLRDQIRTTTNEQKELTRQISIREKHIQELKAECQRMQQQLNGEKENREKVDQLQKILSTIHAENTNLNKECNELRLKSKEYDKLRKEMTVVTIAQKDLVQKISAKEEQIRKLDDERQLLKQKNHDIITCVSGAYRALGKCISERCPSDN